MAAQCLKFIFWSTLLINVICHVLNGSRLNLREHRQKKTFIIPFHLFSLSFSLYVLQVSCNKYGVVISRLMNIYYKMGTVLIYNSLKADLRFHKFLCKKQYINKLTFVFYEFSTVCNVTTDIEGIYLRRYSNFKVIYYCWVSWWLRK